MRRVFLAFVVAMLVGGVYFVLSQTTNKLTFVNNSSEPRTVEYVSVATYTKSTDEWNHPTVLVNNYVMQPNTKLTLTFSGRGHSRIVVCAHSGYKNVMTTSHWCVT